MNQVFLRPIVIIHLPNCSLLQDSGKHNINGGRFWVFILFATVGLSSTFQVTAQALRSVLNE